MPFDTLHDWCVGLERDLDPVARLSHWIGHAPDPWQVEAFTTQATEIALRVCRQAGKRRCWRHGQSRNCTFPTA